MTGSLAGVAPGSLSLSRAALFEVWRRKGVCAEPDADHYAGIWYTYPAHLAALLAPFAACADRRRIRAHALYIAGSRLFSLTDPVVRKVLAELGTTALGVNVTTEAAITTAAIARLDAKG